MARGIQQGNIPQTVTLQPPPQGGASGVQHNGLQQIQGQQPGGHPGSQPQVGANVAVNSGGVGGLAQIQGSSLDHVTGKHSVIRQGLSPGIQTKLDARLQQSNAATAKDVKSLLHFGWRGRGATTKETRVAIRTALAAYIAHGGDVQAAMRFKEALIGKTDAQIKQMLAGLKEDKGLPLAALSQGLLQTTSPSARRDFQQFKQVLTGFPPDVAKANAVELVDGNVTLGRDATGQLQIKNHALAFAEINVPASNQGLKRADVDALKQEFRALAAEKYSTQGVALDFIQFKQALNKQRREEGKAPLTMGEALQQFQADGASASTKYHRGDCMCHAEKLKAAIERKGYQVHVIGMNNTSLTKMADPKGGAEKVDISGVDQATEGVTHTDLLIPFTDDQGNRKVLILAPGAGPGDNYLREFALDADGGIVIPEGDRAFATPRRVNGGPGLGMDAAQLQKAQFKFRHNLQMLNSAPGLPAAHAAMVGIDMLAGTIYLNGNASKEFVRQHRVLPGGKDPTNPGSLSFDFKEALADPTGMTTYQVWNKDANAYESKQVTKLMALGCFLRMVQQQFGQDDQWLLNTFSLMVQRDQYNAEILLPSLHTAAETQTLGKQALAVASQLSKAEKTEHARLLNEAGDAVHAADAAKAKACYAAAIVVADRIAADALIKQLPPNSAALASAQAARALAQQAIDAGDPATAARHLNLLLRQGLTALGAQVTDNTSATTLRALADFPIASRPSMVSKILALDFAGRVATNSLSTDLAGLVANIAKHSPALANRIHQLALREIAGLEKPGTADFMATHALNDQYMADLQSPLDFALLPTSATLGFDPTFHIALSPDKYLEAKTSAQRLQADGLYGKLQFDDATHTIHMGYTYQAFSDIGLSLDYTPRADGTKPRDDFDNLKTLFRDAANDTGKLPLGLQLEVAFGNPLYQANRQNSRFEAVYDMFDKWNSFDFASYDVAYSPEVRKSISDGMQGKSIADQMTELLNRYDGFIIGDEHGDAQMKQALYDNLDHLAAKNVKVIGIEHLKEAEFGELLSEYFAAPQGSPMSKDLRAALTTADSKYAASGSKLYGSGNCPKFFVQIVEKAKQLGMELAPLDTENNNASGDEVHGYEVRMGAMNMVGEKFLRPKLARLDPGAKYVLFAGAAHNNTHVGLTNGMPGFAQTLGIPAVRVEVDKDAATQGPIATGPGQVKLHLELDLEDPSKRRAPTLSSPN